MCKNTRKCSKSCPSFRFFSLSLPVRLALSVRAVAHGIYTQCVCRTPDKHESICRQTHGAFFEKSETNRNRVTLIPVSRHRTAFLSGAVGEKEEGNHLFRNAAQGRQAGIPGKKTGRQPLVSRMSQRLILSECFSNLTEPDALFIAKCASH